MSSGSILRKENLQETGGGRLVYRAKAVDKSSESGIINYARATEIFTVKNYYANYAIDLAKKLDYRNKNTYYMDVYRRYVEM